MNDIVAVDPERYVHTAAAGRVIALAVNDVGTTMALMELTYETGAIRTHWVAYLDGQYVTHGTSYRDCVSPGFLCFRKSAEAQPSESDQEFIDRTFIKQ